MRMTPRRPGCHWESRDGNKTAVFSLWAPAVASVELLRGAEAARYPLQKDAEGYWNLHLPGMRPGETYGFIVDGRGPFPDPASRFQPEGVHGLSQAVDLSGFAWQHPRPRLPVPARRSVYELHLGTFTPEGTFAAAAARLEDLKRLGVTLIELMPVADFPGERNWGYDGVALFAPARCYGTPEALCRLVDAAHGWGLGVILDVVYNHFGPDGNYTGVYSSNYLNPEKSTPWGAAVNFDGIDSRAVRDFYASNVRQWMGEYRFDGLRFDATHAILDASHPHILAELTQTARQTARQAAPERELLLYAEDHRNPAAFPQPIEKVGMGFDGVWADDFHHHLRRHLAGDHEGYYAHFDGTAEHIARTLARGWFRDGSRTEGSLSEGSNPDPLDYSRFLICIQNHDQIGNRAFGERLHQQIAPDLYRAASALLLLAPETPLLFMGQEWACSSPFQFFTDHSAALGPLVTAGRRKEFAGFSAFQDPAVRATIPDPQALTTFQRSRLQWEERGEDPHRGQLEFYRALLQIRGAHPALDSVDKKDFHVRPRGAEGLVLIRSAGNRHLLAVICLSPQGMAVELPPAPAAQREWTPLLTSEDRAFESNPRDIQVGRGAEGAPTLSFPRGGAWIAEA